MSSSVAQPAQLHQAELATHLFESAASDITAQMPSIKDKAGLQAAFVLFNQVSAQLNQAYGALEDRVAVLTTELQQVDKQRLAELHDKERISGRLRNLLDLLPGGVIVLDKHGVIREINPAAVEFLGEPLAGLRWIDVIQRCFAPRRDDGHEISLKDGRKLSLATRSLEGEPGQILLLTDQTETRELQRRLGQQDRLLAMGKMMSALAHQIRTPLATAMLYSGHLCRTDLNPDQQQRFSHKVLSRLRHMERQIKDMLLFVRGEIKRTDLVTVDTLIRAVIEAADEPRLQVTVAKGCAGLSVLCNQETVIGAILNLINNSYQASAKEADVSLQATLIQDRYLEIAIIDQGHGFDQATGNKINEAFFTTKAQGTGLGLVVVRAVAKAHDGFFEICSQPGKGTRAALCLPVHLHVEEHSVGDAAQ